MFVSIHIPKTAGTSLSVIFDYGVKRRIWYDYSGWKELREPQHSLSARKEVELDNKSKLTSNLEFIEENFEFVHGHFFYTKYEDVFKNARFISCVRRPIDRLISHYYHILDEADENYWLYNEMMSDSIDLVDFAKVDFIGNIQTRFLEGRSVSDYDFIFVSESLADSIYHFQLMFDFERNDEYMNFDGKASIPNRNLGTNKKTNRKFIPKHHKIRASEVMVEDNETYALALEKFKQQAKMAENRLRKL